MGVHWTLISDHQVSNHHCTSSHVEIRIYQSGDPFRVIASQNVTLLRIRVYVQLVVSWKGGRVAPAPIGVSLVDGNFMVLTIILGTWFPQLV